MSWLASTTGGAPAGAWPGGRLLERVENALPGGPRPPDAYMLCPDRLPSELKVLVGSSPGMPGQATP